MRVLQEGEVGAGDEIVKVAAAQSRSQSQRSMPFSIFQAIRATGSNAHRAFPH